AVHLNLDLAHGYTHELLKRRLLDLPNDFPGPDLASCTEAYWGTSAIEHQIRPTSITLHRVDLPDGYVAFVKATCPTCQLVAPVLHRLREAGVPLRVYSQDDPAFPEGADPLDDTELRRSYEMGVEVVPTLIRVEGGVTTDRLQGWLRTDWERLTGVTELGQGLPDYRAGCGSRTLDPGMPEQLAALYGGE